jgi:putative Holliday junction resolvase
MSVPFPRTGRLLAIDFGRVRVGFAVSDHEQTLASPLENYTRRDPNADANYLRQLIEGERIAGIVIGLPVHMSGDESQKSTEARSFGAWVAEVSALPIRYQDERYSSAMADQFMAEAGLTAKQRKKRRDMLAAQVILASFLESTDRDL